MHDFNNLQKRQRQNDQEPVLKKRLLMILTAFDHWLMTMITLGNCRPGEYISSAAWSLERDGKLLGRIFRPLIDRIFARWESDHCYKSWLGQKHLYPDPSE